jgi:hypothetical protein
LQTHGLFARFILDKRSIVTDISEGIDVSWFPEKSRRFPALTQKTFQGLNLLIKLDLSGNENCNIAPGTFDNILSLRELSLAEMNLETKLHTVSVGEHLHPLVHSLFVVEMYISININTKHSFDLEYIIY